MTLPIALMLAGLVLLGLCMIVLARRGRRINRVPACRQCQFDLSSVLPVGITCPECGAGIKRPQAVHIGQRKRMPILGLAGAVLVMLPGSLLGTALILQATNTSLDRYKPWRLVLWEARYGSKPMVEAAATEIERRHTLSLLTGDQREEAIEAALDIQADSSRPWSEKLGDLVEVAAASSMLRPEQYSQFVQNGIVLEARTRPAVGIADPIPLTVKVIEVRCGKDSSISGTLNIKSARIGGRAVEVHSVQGSVIDGPWAFSQSGAHIGSVNVMGSRWAGMSGASGSGQAWATLKVPTGLAPASHILELEIGLDAYSQTMMVQAGTMVNALQPSTLAVTRRFTLPVDITPEATSVRLIESTPDLDKKMALAVTVMQGGAWFTPQIGGRGMLQLTLQIDKPPHPIAHDVFVRTSKGEWRLCSVNSDPDQNGQQQMFFSGLGPQPSVDYRSIWGETPRLDEAFDLVFRPNPAVAASTVSLDSLYNGEFVITGVEAQHMQEDRTGSTLNYLWRFLFGN